MFVVAATPTEDGGPFTVHRADGTEPPRRVHRRELQLCPVGLSPPQDDPESPAEQCAHQDSSSMDTDCEPLQIRLLAVMLMLMWQRCRMFQ